jgi:hypothetical protein
MDGGVQSQVSLHGRKECGAWPQAVHGISCERWRLVFSTVSHMALLLSGSTAWLVTLVRMLDPSG